VVAIVGEAQERCKEVRPLALERAQSRDALLHRNGGEWPTGAGLQGVQAGAERLVVVGGEMAGNEAVDANLPGRREAIAAGRNDLVNGRFERLHLLWRERSRRLPRETASLRPRLIHTSALTPSC